jgi:hypothetical protein
MTNRINGDFEQDAIEAFRAAYAAQLSNPEDHEIDPINGLPTNVVHNTSPWIQHTGLWKANDGMSRDFKPNQPFNPDDYFPASPGDGADGAEGDDDADDADDAEASQDPDENSTYLTDEEFERLSEEIWGSDGGDSDGNTESDSDDNDNDNETQYEEDPYVESEVEGEEELNEDEIDTLIDEILSEGSDEHDEDGNEDNEDGEYNDED